MSDKLTKADTVALWYAVQAFGDIVKAMADSGFSQEQINPERERLVIAKRALRKVNELRKQQL